MSGQTVWSRQGVQRVRIVRSGPRGPAGASGSSSQPPWDAPAPQTTHVVPHTLGRNPLGVFVLDADSGAVLEGWGYEVLSPSTVRISFDLPLRARVHLT